MYQSGSRRRHADAECERDTRVEAAKKGKTDNGTGTTRRNNGSIDLFPRTRRAPIIALDNQTVDRFLFTGLKRARESIDRREKEKEKEREGGRSNRGRPRANARRRPLRAGNY